MPIYNLHIAVGRVSSYWKYDQDRANWRHIGSMWCSSSNKKRHCGIWEQILRSLKFLFKFFFAFFFSLKGLCVQGVNHFRDKKNIAVELPYFSPSSSSSSFSASSVLLTLQPWWLPLWLHQATSPIGRSGYSSLLSGWDLEQGNGQRILVHWDP